MSEKFLLWCATLLTRVHPLHAIRKVRRPVVVVVDAQTVRTIRGIRSIRMQIVPSPAWVRDDGVRAGHCSREGDGVEGEHRGVDNQRYRTQAATATASKEEEYSPPTSTATRPSI